MPDDHFAEVSDLNFFKYIESLHAERSEHANLVDRLVSFLQERELQKQQNVADFEVIAAYFGAGVETSPSKLQPMLRLLKESVQSDLNTLNKVLSESESFDSERDRVILSIENLASRLQLQKPRNQSTWIPLENSLEITSSSRLKEIEKIPVNHDHAFDLASSLRATWYGKLYINHFKRYSGIRSLTISAWRTFYPLYCKYILGLFQRNEATRWRKLTPLSNYVDRENVNATLISAAEVIDTPTPYVESDVNQKYLVSPHPSYIYPKVYLSRLDHATIYGGTNLILVKGEVICHDLYDFTRDYTSEELHGRAVIDPNGCRIKLLVQSIIPRKLSSAASFVDACAPNYAHWITEVLPRIAAFCSIPGMDGIPIIVNDGLHANIMSSLLLMVGSERELILLPIGGGIQVEKLYLTSAAGYVPFERRNTVISGHSHGKFCPHAFQLMRNKFLALAENLHHESYPKKIYLRRNSEIRKIINAPAVEEFLVRHGYAIVEPEKLSFLQQVFLFSNAKRIVASSGAALANLIFSPKDSTLTILIGKELNTSYWYWQNMACAAGGGAVGYVLGTPADGGGIHANFSIDVNNLKLQLDIM